MAASKSDKTLFSSTASTSSSLSALSSETPENEFKCEDVDSSIAPALLNTRQKQSAANKPNARSILFLGHEGSGKTMVVEAMAQYLQQQKGYKQPSIVAAQRNDELGFNMAVDEIHFKERMSLLHFPDLACPTTDCVHVPTFRRDRIAVFKESFSRKFPHIDAIFLVLRSTKDFDTMNRNRCALLLAVLDLFDGQDVASNTFVVVTKPYNGAKVSRERVRALCGIKGIEKLSSLMWTNTAADECNGISHITDCFTIDVSAIPIKNTSTKNDRWFATDTSAIVIDNSSTFNYIFSVVDALTSVPTTRQSSSKKATTKQRRSELFEDTAAEFEKSMDKKLCDLKTSDDQ